MADYGLLYRQDYDTLGSDNCRVEIHKKDYAGDFFSLELSGEPVVQNWATDEQKPSIKGCSLSLTFHNKGTIPIDTFYSEEDDTFKIVHYKNSNVTFVGFVVMEDCSEDMVDFRHEITLSANDNLGLLKDVPLSTLPDIQKFPAAIEFTLNGDDGIITLYHTDFIPEVGVPFTISGYLNPDYNGTYTPVSIQKLGSSGWVINVGEVFDEAARAWPSFIAGNATFNLENFNTLLNIIRICLFNTGIDLEKRVYDNVFEDSHYPDQSPLEQTYIDPRTFLAGDKYKSCWDVLEWICQHKQLTIFQANGVWNIMRWPELRYRENAGYEGGAIPYHIYNINWEYQGLNTLSTPIEMGFQQAIYPETSPLRTIIRPYKFDKETFNYKQPERLINNSDLQQLGAFVSSLEFGDGKRYDRYEFPASSKWEQFFMPDPIYRAVIEVVTDLVDETEVERRVKQIKVPAAIEDTLTGFTNVEFNDVPVSEGDTFDFEFRVKSLLPTGGDALQYRVGFFLLFNEGSYYHLTFSAGPDSNQTRWVFNAAPMGGGIGPAVTVLAENAEEWYEYKASTQPQQEGIKIPPFPSDGVLRIRIFGTNTNADSQPEVDCVWKDIRLTLTQIINDSTKVIGHTHLQEQDKIIKKNLDEEIFLDDSPRSTIAGTLYKVAPTGLVLNRTTKWYRSTPTTDTERLRLGELIVGEELYARRKPQTKIEGTFYGLDGVSMLSKILYHPFDLQFVFGSLEISYKSNSFRATIYEMVFDTEDPEVFDSTYTFKYLFRVK